MSLPQIVAVLPLNLLEGGSLSIDVPVSAEVSAWADREGVEIDMRDEPDGTHLVLRRMAAEPEVRG